MGAFTYPPNEADPMLTDAAYGVVILLYWKLKNELGCIYLHLSTFQTPILEVHGTFQLTFAELLVAVWSHILTYPLDVRNEI
jgi:hypothetical protein